MITLGVTGGIGSGKSTVCQFIAQHGVRIFEADTEAKALMVADDGAVREIKELLGEEAYLPDGSLNRKWIAGKVFSDEELRNGLNGIVHPRVRRRFEEVTALATAKGEDLVVYEAALIFESGGDKVLDLVAVVHAPEIERIIRVVARDGASREAVQARIQAQLPAEELLDRADYVVINDGTLEELAKKADALWEWARDEHRPS